MSEDRILIERAAYWLQAQIEDPSSDHWAALDHAAKEALIFRYPSAIDGHVLRRDAVAFWIDVYAALPPRLSSLISAEEIEGFVLSGADAALAARTCGDTRQARAAKEGRGKSGQCPLKK